MFFRVSPSLSSRYFRSVTLHCRFKARELFLFRKTRGTRNANKNIRAALRGGRREIMPRVYNKILGRKRWLLIRLPIWLHLIATSGGACACKCHQSTLRIGEKKKKGNVCLSLLSLLATNFISSPFFEKFFERINKESKEKQNTKRGWTKWKLFLQRSSRIGNILENENLWWRVLWMLFKDDSSNKPSLLIFNLARRLASRASSSRLFIPAGGGEKKKGKKLWCS